MQQQPIRLFFRRMVYRAQSQNEVLLYEERLLTEFDSRHSVQSFHNCMIKCMCFSVNVCFNNLVAFSRCFHCDNLCEFIEPTSPYNTSNLLEWIIQTFIPHPQVPTAWPYDQFDVFLEEACDSLSFELFEYYLI